MGDRINVFKTTIIGGLVFLVPIVIVAAILGKVYKIMMLVARPLDGLIPLERVGGMALANILAVAILIIVCYLAGIAAKSSLGKSTFQLIDSNLMMLLPGYAFVKGMTDSIAEKDEQGLRPVLVKLDDSMQIGFEVERIERGLVVVYLPGAPNPWSGTISYVEEARIEPMNQTMTEVVKSLGKLGPGSSIL
jgi:uncharacterized membrane protein